RGAPRRQRTPPTRPTPPSGTAPPTTGVPPPTTGSPRPMIRRLLPALLAVAVVFAFSGCGSGDVRNQVERTRQQVEARVTHAQKEFEKRQARFGKRIQKVLGDL